MLDPKPFIAKASSYCDSQILAYGEAQIKIKDSLLSQSGLLCATDKALLFV